MSDTKITVQNASDGFGVRVQNYGGDEQLMLTFLDDEGASIKTAGIAQCILLDLDAARHLAKLLPVVVDHAEGA